MGAYILRRLLLMIPTIVRIMAISFASCNLPPAVPWNRHRGLAPDLFSRAPDLKVVFSGDAGVYHVLTLPGLPDVPLVFASSTGR
ncbi:hypothetical protein ATY30_19140 [Sinorhizobium americanum]|uniref:Uncharacterized protein n=1 Tax=Sinorhizobium americanum TaxID=194963 RepID=A0A2S3YQR9_9HYPH|nr:hypothetical protein ATY30_19140 [Sinorhizobium americanum]POH33641.1 hypothetical protein ATY31_10110 [Sinorhizobium americanum]